MAEGPKALPPERPPKRCCISMDCAFVIVPPVSSLSFQRLKGSRGANGLHVPASGAGRAEHLAILGRPNVYDRYLFSLAN